MKIKKKSDKKCCICLFWIWIVNKWSITWSKIFGEHYSGRVYEEMLLQQSWQEAIKHKRETKWDYRGKE